jgi:hypothetical protein
MADSIDGLSPQRFLFSSRLILVQLVMERLALRQVFLRVLRRCLSTIAAHAFNNYSIIIII